MLRTIAALLLAVSLGATASAVTAAEKKKSGSHGAIAANRDSKAVGYAHDFKTAQDAKREALAQCGEKQCEVVVTFRGGCAAAARGGKRLTAATGATREEAETKATRKCGKDCAVLAWACTRDK